MSDTALLLAGGYNEDGVVEAAEHAICAIRDERPSSVKGLPAVGDVNRFADRYGCLQWKEQQGDAFSKSNLFADATVPKLIGAPVIAIGLAWLASHKKRGVKRVTRRPSDESVVIALLSRAEGEKEEG